MNVRLDIKKIYFILCPGQFYYKKRSLSIGLLLMAIIFSSHSSASFSFICVFINNFIQKKFIPN